MHIAFLTSEYPPLPSGGIGTSIRNLARALVAMGHRVTVIGWGAQTAFEDEGVRVRFLGHTRIPKLGWLLNRWRVAREINRLVREEGLDIVEAPDWCGMSAGLRPGTSENGPQTIDLGPGATDQGPRIVEAGKQSPERSERGECSEPTPSLPAAAAFVPGSAAPATARGPAAPPPTDTPPSASPIQPSAVRLEPSAFRLGDFLVRHLGFRIHCPLVVRCHGTATYFAYLERLQARIEAKRQHAETSDEGRRTKDDEPPVNVKRLVRWAEGLALRQASSIVAVSRFCAETTAELFGLEGKRSLFTDYCSLLTVKGSGVRCQVSGMGSGVGGRGAGFGSRGSGEVENPGSNVQGLKSEVPRTPVPDQPPACSVQHSAFSIQHSPGPPSPIRVIPNGIDIRQFTPARPDEVEPDTLLYFGTLARKKGVLDLPAIFNRVVEQVPQARLRLIGRDNPDARTGAPSTWELMQRGFSAAALPRVEYLGMKPYAEVQNYVRRATVCVFPSYAEAFPVSWLEAMACARPVVAYDIGWAQEVIEPGVSGSLVRPGDTAAFADAVVACLRGPQRSLEMGQAARRRVEQTFTANAVAERSIAWYAAVGQGL